MKKQTKTLEDTSVLVSSQQLVQLTNLSVVTVNKAVHGGYVEKASHGHFVLRQAFAGMLRYVREHPGQHAKAKGGTKADAATRVQDARAKQIEMQMAIERKELITINDAVAVIDILLGGVRVEMEGFPARLTRDKTLRAQYEVMFTESLTRLATKWAKMMTDFENAGNLEEEDS